MIKTKLEFTSRLVFRFVTVALLFGARKGIVVIVRIVVVTTFAVTITAAATSASTTAAVTVYLISVR
jgi:hypothetical protein